MRLTVFSCKVCWPSADSPTGFATDGGFAFQMKALSELFDETRLVVPVDGAAPAQGQVAVVGRNLRVVSLPVLRGRGLQRRLRLLPWLLSSGPRLLGEAWRADAVHAPIPADVGTFGMLLAYVLGKPLFVRYCGNWEAQRTLAERSWRWFMEVIGGGRNVMLVTGGSANSPSRRNPAVRWIFSTTMTESEISSCALPRRLAAESARLITVSRQEAGKGTDILIRSLNLVQKQLPRVTLCVVGDGSAVSGLKSLAAEAGLADKVVFTGRLSHAEVLERLRHSDLFCYPTASEGFPKAVLEAMACGLPVVTTPVSVLAQLVGNGCGMLLQERSEAAVAAAVVQCLQDPERYARMSHACLDRARGYSIERWRQSIGDVLQHSWGPLALHA